MTTEQLKTFITAQNDENEIPEALLDFLIDNAQAYWENRRPWVALRTEDTSETVSPNNTFETAKSLPTDFRKWYTRFPIVLTDAQGRPQQYLAEIPINMKSSYKDDPRKFYASYGAKQFFICGAPSTTQTVRQYYIKKGTKLTADESNTWDLDPNDEYTKIIGFTVLVYYKHGVDYDVINNKQGDANGSFANQIFTMMEEWDAELAESALNGQEYGGFGGGFSADGLSGHVSNLL